MHLDIENIVVSTNIDDEKQLNTRNAPSSNAESMEVEIAVVKGSKDIDVQELDVRGTADISGTGAGTSTDVDYTTIYYTEVDCNFLQKMCELHAEMKAVDKEVHEEYLEEDDADRKVLEKHSMSLWEEYKEYEKVHKAKYGVHCPPLDIRW
jgi:hypothetical protein